MRLPCPPPPPPATPHPSPKLTGVLLLLFGRCRSRRDADRSHVYDAHQRVRPRWAARARLRRPRGDATAWPPTECGHLHDAHRRVCQARSAAARGQNLPRHDRRRRAAEPHHMHLPLPRLPDRGRSLARTRGRAAHADGRSDAVGLLVYRAALGDGQSRRFAPALCRGRMPAPAACRRPQVWR